MARLAASLLTSHSQGPGRVSSKSLMSKTRFPLGRGEQPKIQQVCVPAHLRGHSCAGSAGQVGGHEGGGASVEAERGLQHPAVADGHEVRQPGGRLRLDDVHGVRPGRRGPVFRVGGARRLRSRGPSARGPFLRSAPAGLVRHDATSWAEPPLDRLVPYRALPGSFTVPHSLPGGTSDTSRAGTLPGGRALRAHRRVGRCGPPAVRSRPSGRSPRNGRRRRRSRCRCGRPGRPRTGRCRPAGSPGRTP